MVILVVALGMFSGCGDLIPPRPPIGRTPQSPAEPEGSAASAALEVDEPTEEAFEGDWNAWHVYRFGSQIVGYAEVSATSLVDSSLVAGGVPEVQYTRKEHMLFRATGASFVRVASTTSIETTKGALNRFESEIRNGPVGSVTKGTRGGANMVVSTRAGGEEKSVRFECPVSTRGLFALEQTLRRDPIEKGQTRRLPVILPSMDSVGLIEMVGKGESSVGMLDGSYVVMNEVEVVTYRDAKAVDSIVVWTDSDGVIKKTLRPHLRLESFQTDRSTAQERFGLRDESTVTVSVAGNLSTDKEPSQVAFVIIDKEGKQEGSEKQPLALPSAANQSVRPVADGWQVLVSSAATNSTGFEQDDRDPRESDSQPTAIIDSGNAVVTRTANSVAESASTKDLARELSQVTKNLLSLAPQSDLRPASRILRERSGGTIDHAVVLASLLRARNLPTQIALGLVRSDQPATASEDRINFELAAWVVAFIDDRWVSIDPMTSKFNRADQLCLSRVSDDNELEAELMRVFRQISEMEIEIRGARYGSSP